MKPTSGLRRPGNRFKWNKVWKNLFWIAEEEVSREPLRRVREFRHFSSPNFLRMFKF